jgi:hypothetical protein
MVVMVQLQQSQVLQLQELVEEVEYLLDQAELVVVEWLVAILQELLEMEQ